MKKNFIGILAILIGTLMSVQADSITVGHTSGYDYKSITHAMAAASAGDYIRVAGGTYSADNPSYPETFPITMKAGVTLIREASNVTPVIDANQTERVFLCMNIPETQPAFIEGFKITGGLLDSGMMAGAGVYVYNSYLTLRYCNIVSNTSTGSGAGLTVTAGSKVELQNCTVQLNSTTVQYGNGGGIYSTSSDLILKTCDISENNAKGQGGGIYSRDGSVSLWKTLVDGNHSDESGGGIHLDDASIARTIQIEQCSIVSNTSDTTGGGINFTSMNPEPMIAFCYIGSNVSQEHGGGVAIYGSNPILAFNSINGNTSHRMGGGVYLDASSTKLISCSLSGNTADTGAGLSGTVSSPIIMNDLFTDNYAYEFGGAIYGLNSSLSITNCTMEGNHAADAGGAIALNTVDMTMVNSILWNNSIDEFYQTGSTPVVAYCNVQGGFAGTGNINLNPLFVSGMNGDYFLSQTASGDSANSPCIDAGSDLSSNISYTHDGDSFRLSETSTRTDRVPDAGMADMGYHMFRNPTECCWTECIVQMPAAEYVSGDLCYCDVMVCNADWEEIPNTPIFVLLEVAGYLFFAPEFDDFAFYQMTVYPGVQYIHVIPRFEWPSGAGSASNVNWYAAMTNPEMTELVGGLGTFTFGWH